MAQYLLAQWDYTAEGNFELSFKEGDKIKLLEKHNDDWWEGELNDEIGFFPANRAKVFLEAKEQQQQDIDLVKKASISSSTSSSSTSRTTIPIHVNNSAEYNNNNNVQPPERPVLLPVGSNTSVSHSNPYLQTTNKLGNEREAVSAPTIPRVQNENILVDISTENEELPSGWSHSHDEAGTIYFFKKDTGESQWEKPSIKSTNQNENYVAEKPLLQTPSAPPPPPPPLPQSVIKKIENNDINDLTYDIQKLNLEALHPNWIRIQSNIQIKVVSSTDEETELHWKDYYGVLTNGFLLVYKEGLNKMGRRPSSIKPVPAYFTVNLKSSEITPATKTDTRKKHAFIISLPNHKVFVNINNEATYAEWLDAIMREMISVKENVKQQDADLVQLLASIPLYSKLELHKSTLPAENMDDSKSAKTLTRWFSRSSRNSIHRSQTLPTSSSTTITESSGNEVFGGHLKLDEDGNIPKVIRLCIEQVDKRGLDVVGIYRLSGQTTSIQKYKAQFNQRPIEEIQLGQEHDINVITGLLKLYFRELKNPLLTFEYYDRFIEAAKLQDYDERMFRLKSIIQVLPVVNYKVVQYLARHLERVKNNSHVNKMEASNLALIFSIGLLRPKHDDLSTSIMHNDLLCKVVEIIITHVDWFFDTDTDDDNSSVNNNSSLVFNTS